MICVPLPCPQHDDSYDLDCPACETEYEAIKAQMEKMYRAESSVLVHCPECIREARGEMAQACARCESKYHRACEAHSGR
jgi:hypothetical protein